MKIFFLIAVVTLVGCSKEPQNTQKALTEAQKNEINARLGAPVQEEIPTAKPGGFKAKTF